MPFLNQYSTPFHSINISLNNIMAAIQMFAEYDTEEAVLYDEIEWVADIPNQPGPPLPVDDLRGEDLEDEAIEEMDDEEAPGDNLDLAAPAVPAVPALLPAPVVPAREVPPAYPEASNMIQVHDCHLCGQEGLVISPGRLHEYRLKNHYIQCVMRKKPQWYVKLVHQHVGFSDWPSRPDSSEETEKCKECKSRSMRLSQQLLHRMLEHAEFSRTVGQLWLQILRECNDQKKGRDDCLDLCLGKMF